ncbi:hypothetical protein ABBQ32_012746 [Trebouxia sp. C0010 RCD-2024]
MQEREQKALSSSLRALELQQLAAGSNSPLDANQLSAAAQRCTSEAEQAAQMASLARAEAARLLGHGPALGVSAERPAPALMDTAAFLACDDTPAVGAAMQLRPNAQTDAPSPEQAQLSTSSVDVVRGLSADMQAAMQRLVASTRSSSSAAVPGPESEIATPSGAGVHAGGTGTATEYGQGQGVPDLSIPNLAASSAYQMPHLPNQESWQIPALDSASPVRSAEDAQIPPLSDQGTVEVAEDRGLSGMQIHLMQQLEGLERSMRRVEQQVSSTKQTRRRLKTPSSPAQGDDAMVPKIPYLDGLPMEYWVVPPRSAVSVSPSLTASLSASLHRVGYTASLASRTVTRPTMPPPHGHTPTAHTSRSSSYAHAATSYRQHLPSFPRTRLPMSAYATPQHTGQHPKENWQEEMITTKSPVQTPRGYPMYPLHNSN